MTSICDNTDTWLDCHEPHLYDALVDQWVEMQEADPDTQDVYASNGY